MVFGTGAELHHDTTHQGGLLANQVWIRQHLTHGAASETKGIIGRRTAVRILDLDKPSNEW